MKLVIAMGSIAASLMLFTTGCTSFFKRDPASIVKHKHYIMTLHGVRGNAESFGDFNDLITTHLEKVDPAYEVVPVGMTYSIAQIDYTPEKAAKEINEKLVKLVPNLDPKDKFSVVGYSMGGQVGLAWFYGALKDERYAKYARQTDKFISLGGAFWGAKEAALFTSDVDVLRSTIKLITLEMRDAIKNKTKDYLGDTAAEALGWFQRNGSDKAVGYALSKLKSIDDLRKFYDDNLRPLDAVKISFAELQALSLGSITPTNMRLAVLSEPTKTKFVSISTLVTCFESDKGAKIDGCDDFQNTTFEKINQINSTYTFGFKRRESDNAVITPSSIAHFLYVSKTDSNYKDGERTTFDEFRYSIPETRHKVYFAETLHATVITAGMYDRADSILTSLGGSWGGLKDDVVLVYKRFCEDPKQCDHKAYKFIANELANCDRENSTCDQDEYENVIGNLLKDERKVNQAQETLKSELHGFTVDLTLRVPKGYPLNKIDSTNIMKYIQADFVDKAANGGLIRSADSAQYEIHLARPLEIASKLVKKVNIYGDQDQLKVNLTGLIIPKASQQYDYKSLEKGTLVSLDIKLPGLKSRKVDAKVRPYYSTFIDLKMAP